jgi:hypothetical protein
MDRLGLSRDLIWPNPIILITQSRAIFVGTSLSLWRGGRMTLQGEDDDRVFVCSSHCCKIGRHRASVDGGRIERREQAHAPGPNPAVPCAQL